MRLPTTNAGLLALHAAMLVVGASLASALFWLASRRSELGLACTMGGLVATAVFALRFAPRVPALSQRRQLMHAIVSGVTTFTLARGASALFGPRTLGDIAPHWFPMRVAAPSIWGSWSFRIAVFGAALSFFSTLRLLARVERERRAKPSN